MSEGMAYMSAVDTMPLSVVAGRDEAVDLFRASRTRRVLNYVVDTIAFYACTFFVSAVLGFYLGLAGFDVERLFSGALPYLLSVSIYFLFYGFFEGVFGRSPGKWLTRTEVVDLDGARPSFAHVLARTFARFLPLAPIWLALHGIALHDRVTSTRVVESGPWREYIRTQREGGEPDRVS